MTTKQLAPLARINQQLAPTFRAAAPDELTWAQEKTFLEAQIRKHWQIEKAVTAQVPQTIESIKLAVRECASMGLSMSPTAQLAYFIPRRARRKFDNESKADYERNVPWVVNLHPSYRGLSYIATHYAGADMLAAEVVFRDDVFRYFGPVREPEHEPTLDPKLRTESKAIGVYAVAIMSSGRVRAEYVDRDTIARIRALSDHPGGLMWTKLWTEGWRKVAIRRICKTIMTTEPRLEAAIRTLDRNEGITLEADVSRGTPDARAPDFETEPQGADPARGSAGLGAALKTAQTRYTAPREPEELDPTEDTAEEASAAPGEPQEPQEAETAPAQGEFFTSQNPPGSIEWWGDRIRAASTMDALDKVRADALAKGVDRDQDLADPFRQMYARRARAIREGVTI